MDESSNHVVGLRPASRTTRSYIRHCMVSPPGIDSKSPLASLPRHLQPRHAPQPIRAPGTHGVTVAVEEDADAPVAIARILASELAHAREDRRVGGILARSITEGRSRHLKKRAGPPLRQATACRKGDGLPTSQHAYQFFAAISFITSISRSRSATSFFSRAFSSSSAFSRRTSFASIVPNRRRQT